MIVYDAFLAEILEQKRKAGEVTSIVETIQKNQNDIVVLDSNKNILVQGCAGSGKTMILLQRIHYLEYRKIPLADITVIFPSKKFHRNIEDVIDSLYIGKANYYSYIEFLLNNILAFHCTYKKSNIKKALANLEKTEASISFENDAFYFSENTLSMINDIYFELKNISDKKITYLGDNFKGQKTGLTYEQHQKEKEKYIACKINKEKDFIVKTLFESIYIQRDTIKKQPYTRGEIFLHFYILSLVYGYKNKNQMKYLFIDEAQDISACEYGVLFNMNNSAYINLFGDIRQKIESVIGIPDWDDIKPVINNHVNYFVMNENYRSSIEIVDYVNMALNVYPKIIAMGIRGEAIEKNLQIKDICIEIEKQKNYRKRVAVIYSKQLSRPDILEILKNEKLSPYLYTVEQSKGMEFDTVFAIPYSMTEHEKYIAYTRALSKLYIM